jgi:hypothetical protein
MGLHREKQHHGAPRKGSSTANAKRSEPVCFKVLKICFNLFFFSAEAEPLDSPAKAAAVE